MKNIIYCAMLSIAITFAITAYSDSLMSDLEGGLVRLHIIANSNSETDQQIKLAVRDKIISEMGSDLTPDKSAQQALQLANEVLSENGFKYGASSQLCNVYFPKKQYGEFTLPQGNYRAVRVILGEGKGENWWCVLYPPICMADWQGNGDEARMELRKNLNEESYDVISGEVKIKLGIVELVKQLAD